MTYLPANDMPANDMNEVAVAYVVPKSVGSAVVRNRVRRRLKAILQDLAHSDELAPGGYIVGAFQSLEDFSHSQLSNLVEKAFKSVTKLVKIR